MMIECDGRYYNVPIYYQSSAYELHSCTSHSTDSSETYIILNIIQHQYMLHILYRILRYMIHENYLSHLIHDKQLPNT